MKKIVTMLLSLAMIVSLSTPVAALGTKQTFTDVPTNHWAFSYIEEMAAKGIMNGIGNGQFGPNKELSTAEFATMFARAFWPNALAEQTVDEQFFENPSAWWVPYINVVDRKLVLIGTTVNTERRNHMSNGGQGLYVYQWGDYVTEPISRYDMAMMIFNLMNAKDVSLPSTSEQATAQSQIGDWSQVPESYQTAVAVSYAAGILNGKNGGVFAGNDSMTRAEAATVMSRLLAKGIGPDEASETPTPTPVTGGEKDADGYTTANSVNSVKPKVRKNDEYKTMGGGSKILAHYDPNGNFSRPYDEVVAAAQIVSNNGYFTGANVDIGNATLEYDFLALVNEARKAEGLNELQWVPSDAAEEYTLLRAHELTEHFSHGRPVDNPAGAGLDVIARGYTGVQTAFNGWMNSEGHRVTLMDETRTYLCAAQENNYWIITLWDEEFDLPQIEWWATNNYIESYT